MIVFTFLIGCVAGLRTMTAPAAIAWSAWLGWTVLGGTWAGFMASVWAVALFSLAALAEFVTDQLPATPSRKVPMQFGARIVSGAVCGAMLGTAAGATVPGLLVGAAGAVAGTLGGAWARGRAAAAFGQDRPAALLEDAVAIVLGLVAAAAL
ncbi:DUF4126 domain-containing protein [Frigidibacter oleivorans]|uniref:DUF4126 domain-containing protein n=1 Tax=Frigidibacter oleivorans TaxID=2487129 RepID=UPI000F8E25B9|nr:DUF4126 domain-containing protein [Frigidibacter oleivorans]